MLLILCVAVLAHGFSKPAGYLHLPAALAGLYLVWLLPQLAAISRDVFLQREGYDALIAMASLSLLAVWLGWYGVSHAQARPVDTGPLNGIRLPLVLLTLASVSVNLLLARYRLELAGVQQWSGPATIVAFFAQIRDIAFAMALILFLRKPTLFSAAILAINLSVTLPVAFVFFRRAEMVGLLLAILGALWFSRRWVVPAPFIAAVAGALAVVVYVIGPLRRAARQIEFSGGDRPSIFSPRVWANLDISSEVTRSISHAPDVLNAVYVIAYRLATGDYTFGAMTWNAFVHLYVPGQLLGYEFKQSLQIGGSAAVYDQIQATFGHEYQVGTTSLGFGSAFTDFWYFGALYFLLMAWILRRLHLQANRGDIWSQTLFLSLLPLALLSMTHGHAKFFVAGPFLAAVVWGMRWLALRRRPLRRALSSGPLLADRPPHVPRPGDTFASRRVTKAAAPADCVATHRVT